MGHSEDNIWSLLKDLAPLWGMLAFMVMIFYIYAKTPAPPPPRWVENRYVRWLGFTCFAIGIIGSVFQAIHNWRIFFRLH